MPVNFFLTDEDSDISGYKRAILGALSDTPSLVRSVTNTEAGPSSGIQITRTAGGAALAWITDPLDGTDLTAAAWTLHLWALESSAAANAAIRFQVFRYTNAEAASALLDNNDGTELSTTIRDEVITTGNAAITTMNDGDRLVFKVLIDDAGTMATGHTVRFSFNGENPRAEGYSYVTCPDTLVVTAAMPTATRTHVRRHLQDTSATNPLLTDNEIDQAFDAALRSYSIDRPRVVADLASGDGSAFLFPLPRRWVWGLSYMREVVVPYDVTDQVLQTVDPHDWEVEEAVLGLQPVRQLRFRNRTPESGTDNILFRYTTRHVHNDELDTIPTEDFEAVTWLAASYAAETMASRMAASAEPVIAADSVNYRTGRQEWQAVAKNFRERYYKHIRGEAPAGPIFATAEWDARLSTGGDMIFHGTRRR